MSVVLTETSILLWIILSHTCLCTCFLEYGNLCTQELMSHFGIQWVILLQRCCIILGWTWVGSKLLLGCPHVVDHTCWHVAICPAGLLWLHGHGLSLVVKPWARKGIPAMYERSCQVLTWSKPRNRTFCSLSLAACLVTQSFIVVSFLVCCQCIQHWPFFLSLSFTPTLQSGSSPSRLFSRFSWSTVHVGIHGHSIVRYLNALIWNLQYVVGPNKQANKHRYTHLRNAVTLVWGSPRLAPKKQYVLYVVVCFNLQRVKCVMSRNQVLILHCQKMVLWCLLKYNTPEVLTYKVSHISNLIIIWSYHGNHAQQVLLQYHHTW